MRILAIGDVCGNIGCATVASSLSNIKKKENIDLVIINGENSAEGNGITKESAEFLLNIGADCITGGNHTLRRKEILNVLEDNCRVLRPDNIECEVGAGYCFIDCGYTSVAVINLLGTIYLERDKASPIFSAADRLLNKAKDDKAKIILLDFHAEATSEKRALGIYLDGKISAFFGTHTHVQTADAQILPNGTGYITDIGMTGPIQSVLGVKSQTIISRLKGENTTEKFTLADGECMLNGCIFDIDSKSGRCTDIKPVFIPKLY